MWWVLTKLWGRWCERRGVTKTRDLAKTQKNPGLEGAGGEVHPHGSHEKPRLSRRAPFVEPPHPLHASFSLSRSDLWWTFVPRSGPCNL